MGDGSCKQSIPGHDGWFRGTCSRKVKKDGYCGQHHPDAITVRRAKQDAKYQAERTARKEQHKQEELEIERKIQERIDAAVAAALEKERSPK